VNRIAWWTSLLVPVALLASACSRGDDDAATTTSPSTTSVITTTTEMSASTTSSTTTTSIVSAVAPIVDITRMPLTGEPIADESAIPDRPALVVKISNAPPSVLPQAGLNQADIVFEEIVNDNVTRLAAVFHSQGTDPVGPVRSGRAQDINLLTAFNRPLLAWSGGNRAVTAAIEGSDLIDLSNLHTSGYYRRSGRKDPNDLYSSTEVLWGHTPDDATRPSQVFSYLGEGQELTGESATTIEIGLDTVKVRWTYDADTDGYYRTQNGIAHNTETSSGVERVWTRNVVVMQADYGRNTHDGNPDAQVLGSNPVTVFTGGTVRSGIWLRYAATDGFSFFDSVEDLNVLPLQPGRTWIEIPRNVEGVISWAP